MPIKFFSSIFCFLLVSQLVFAKERSIYDLTLRELYNVEVVSAASGVEQKVVSAPANVTVISKEQWQAFGATSLSDVLSMVAGVHVGQPQFYSYYHTAFTIRGLSGFASDKIKLLVDGLPFEYIQLNGLPWGFYMPLTGFSRVEVIKSSGSAVYGADAYAGIINLVSEDYERKIKQQSQSGFEGEFGMRLGNFDDVDVHGVFNGVYGENLWRLSVDYSTSNDDPDKLVLADSQTGLDAVFGSDASLAPGRLEQSFEVLKVLAKWNYRNWYLDYLSWRNFDVGMGVGPAQALVEDSKLRFRYDRLTSMYQVEDWLSGQLDLQWSYMDQVSNALIDVFPDGAILPIGSDGNVSISEPAGLSLFTEGLIGHVIAHAQTSTVNATYQAFFNDNDNLRIQLGFEQQSFEVNEEKNFGPSILDGTQQQVTGQLTDVSDTPYVFIENVERDFWYISYNQQWQINDDVNISAGVRHDHYSDFGDTTNPRFSFMWQMSDKLKFKLFAGSAFKAPTFGQLYAQNNPSSIGNPELEEEQIDSLELGSSIDYMLDDDLLINFNLFRYKAKNLISYQSTPSVEGRIAQNIGEQLGYGGEFSIKWKPVSNITINSHYSYVKANDHKDIDVVGLPTKMFYVDGNWRYNDHIILSLATKWIGSRTRSFTDSRPDLGSYHLTNFSLQYRKLFMDFDGMLTFRNIFNRQAFEPSYGSIPNDYPLNGRHIILGLNRRF